MKTTTGWDNNGNGDNTSGFSAIPTGLCDEFGWFSKSGKYAYLWTSKHYQYDGIHCRLLLFGDSEVARIEYNKNYGLSCRCLKDDSIIIPTNTEASSAKLEKVANVTIGNQIWMYKNLNTNFFRNGDTIPEVINNADWLKAAKAHKPAWCYYENDSSKGKIYGKIYNWYAVNDKRGLAPHGWHIPSDGEWTALINYLGGSKAAGEKLKNATGWKNNGNNNSGFSALPGGTRFIMGSFSHIDDLSLFWSSWELQEQAKYICIYNNSSEVYSTLNPKGCGFYVRCVKDK